VGILFFPLLSEPERTWVVTNEEAPLQAFLLPYRIRPNTYLDDTLGKTVIYSWSMAARRGKSGKRCIFLTQRQKVYFPDTEEV
jgi:hypothetical protein